MFIHKECECLLAPFVEILNALITNHCMKLDVVSVLQECQAHANYLNWPEVGDLENAPLPYVVGEIPQNTASIFD